MAQSDTNYEVIIIGSGFGGLCAALMLRKQGRTNFRILERRSFMGGTWCQNTYPGAAVDVQSPLYSIADEPYDWTQMFAEQKELEQYTKHVITKHGLQNYTDTNTQVERLEWDDHAKRWTIFTNTSRHYRTRFVINASGPLSTPVIPNVDGLDTFAGASFHTNDWDHSVSYRGRNVAVVGSGASAIQVIPAIAPQVNALHVFQRTPHWVMPRHDREFTSWQRALLRNRLAYRALRTGIYWGLETRVIGFKYSQRALRLVAQRQALQHLRDLVPDATLRNKLTPDYIIGCKRILLSNTFYPTLSRPNVTLHDRTDGIRRIEPGGIHTTQGTYLPLDLIVWATGFDAVDGVVSYPVIGRDGRSLRETWSPYPRAYLGTTMPGFPNFFIVTGPNTGIGHTSAIFVIEAQMEYIAQCLKQAVQAQSQTIEVTTDAETDYTNHIHSEMEHTVWKTGGCKSWYQSQSGHVIAMYPGFSFMFRRRATQFQPEHHHIA